MSSPDDTAVGDSTQELVNGDYLDRCFIPYSPESYPTIHGIPITSNDPSLQDLPDQPHVQLCDRAIEYGLRQLETAFLQRLPPNGTSDDADSGPLELAVVCAPHLDCVEAVDIAIRLFARRLGVDLVILDPADFEEGQDGILGLRFTEALSTLYQADQSKSALGLGAIESILCARLPEMQTLRRRRLIYLRDFATFRGALASMLPAVRSVIARFPELLVVAGVSPIRKLHLANAQLSKLKEADQARAEQMSRLRDLNCGNFMQYIGTRPRTSPLFTRLEDVFTAHFVEQHHAYDVIPEIPGQAAKQIDSGRNADSDSEVSDVLGRAMAAAVDKVAAEKPKLAAQSDAPDTDLKILSVIRVVLAKDLPRSLTEIIAKGRQRRFIGANVRVLRWTLSQMGKDLKGPKLAEDWDVLFQAASPEFILEMSSQVLPTARQRALAEALPIAANCLDIMRASRMVDEATKSWEDAFPLPSKDRFLGLLEAKFGTLTDDENRDLLSYIVNPDTITTTFADISVKPSIITALRVSVTLPLLYPEAYQSGILRAEGAAGVLLYGPPGTGKTMACRALAKEGSVRLMQIPCSSVLTKFVGDSEKRVKAIFDLARKIGPCVVFFDELDAVFRSRSSSTPVWHTSTLTEFMQEIDGILTADLNRESRIIVIGATNRPQDLDNAIIRRLPRRLLLDLPTLPEREKILERNLRGETLDSAIVLQTLAAQTMWYSGSDLRHLVRAAAEAALMESLPAGWEETRPGSSGMAPVPARKITLEHFHQAMQEISASGRVDPKSVDALRHWGSGEKHVDKTDEADADQPASFHFHLPPSTVWG